MNFIKDKLFELLLTAIISLVTYIGVSELSKIKGEIRALECDVAITSVEVVYRNFEKNISNYSVDDLDVKTPPFNAFEMVIDRFNERLLQCKYGKTLQTQMISLIDGLKSYFNKEYEKSLVSFNKLEKSRSLSQTLLGISKYRVALSNPRSIEYEPLIEQSTIHFQQATKYGKLEMSSSSIQAVLARRECNPLMFSRKQEMRALKCLKNIVKRGLENANVFYNMAAITSSNGKYSDSINYFKEYLNRGARRHGNRTYTLQDDDFEKYIMVDEKYGPQFINLVNQESLKF